MRRKLGGLLALIVAAGAVLVGGIGARAGTAGSAGVPAGVISGQSRLTAEVARMVRGTGVAAEQQALARYWSPARMRAALPDSQLPAMKQAIANATARRGLSKPPSKPGGPAVKIAPAKAGTPPPSTVPQSYYPNYPIGHPVARTNGKVFFTNSGLNYVCSAAAVNTEGKSAVWTAGHCVSDNQVWNSNWVFVPNYVNGSAPYGYWSSYQLSTTSAWFYNNKDFANDIGAAVLYQTGGYRIVDRVGGQGITWNNTLPWYAYAFGYPQASPFNGQYLVAANGWVYDAGGSIQVMLNDMTGGSSGGPWLRNFDGSWGNINGHNDFKTSQPAYMYSPYYGNNAGAVYNAVRYIST